MNKKYKPSELADYLEWLFNYSNSNSEIAAVYQQSAALIRKSILQEKSAIETIQNYQSDLHNEFHFDCDGSCIDQAVKNFIGGDDE